MAISNNKDIIFYSGVPEDGGKRLDIISNVHTDVITGLVFDAEGKWLISSGDKHVRVFFNVPGHLMQLEELKENKLKAKTEGMKQRIEEQIQSIKGNLEILRSGQVAWNSMFSSSSKTCKIPISNRLKFRES